MSSAAATEFLTKQINIQKETVTFRWLSRALSIHVNVAKNELASFHASSQAAGEPVHATFLLTGDVAPVNAVGSYRDEDEMDVDDSQVETVPVTKLFLVGEDELEAAKAQFTRQPSVHVYSLSPSAIRDAALLATSAERVRPEDVTKGKAFNQLVGIVVGADVKVSRLGKSAAVKTAKANTIATSSKMKSPSEDKKIEKVTDKPTSADKGKAPEKAKVDEKKKGTLDWSKAKTKADKEKDATAAKNEKELIKKESKTSLKEKAEGSKATVKKNSEEFKVAVKKGSGTSNVKVKKESEEPKINGKKVAPEKPKRGTKRPSAVMSLSDSEEETKDDNPAPKAKPRTSASPISSRPASRAEGGVKVKKGVLLSDDDEEDTKKVKPNPKSKPKRQKGKGRAMLSDDEEEQDRSLRAMMDLDDSSAEHDSQLEDEDIEMFSDSEEHIHVPGKRKKKPKKAVPIGSNGLPKKRIEKTRRFKNEKGYMVTQDYSEYETASESEQAPVASDTEKPNKDKGKVKQEDDAASISALEKAAPSKAHPKPRTSTKSSGDGENSAEQSKGGKAVKSESKKSGPGSGGSKSKAGKGGIASYFGKK